MRTPGALRKVGHVDSHMASRTRRGGQSAPRFGRAREVEEKEFLRKVAARAESEPWRILKMLIVHRSRVILGSSGWPSWENTQHGDLLVAGGCICGTLEQWKLGRRLLLCTCMWEFALSCCVLLGHIVRLCLALVCCCVLSKKSRYSPVPQVSFLVVLQE